MSRRAAIRVTKEQAQSYSPTWPAQVAAQLRKLGVKVTAGFLSSRTGGEVLDVEAWATDRIAGNLARKPPAWLIACGLWGEHE